MIKPHILVSKKLGNVIDDLLNVGGFEISALQLFYMNRNNVTEFFEVYKGVLPEFTMMTDYIATAGPVVVLEIRQDDCV